MKLEEVDRAIYEAIRLKVVAGGYLPDIVITGTGDAYNTAKEIADIARLHEYGSRSGAVPARKLWRPSLEEGMEWAAKNANPVDLFLQRMKKY